ncbi:MAG TPA: hypothetical protein PK475_09575, partial [Rectinema sp.]|nr:hypothetical protein [Rectinema sp.]
MLLPENAHIKGGGLMTSTVEVPCWNLDDVFRGFESEEYKKAKNELKSLLETLKRDLTDAKPPSDEKGTANWLFELLSRIDRLETLADTLSAYV